MLDIWLNCRVVLTICNKRTIVYELVWKKIGTKTHEGTAILHPRSNRIKARSPSCRATVMQQRMTSYPLVALRFLIYHPQRTMWRLNQERGPHTIPAVLSVACIAKYGDNLAESNDSQCRPLKMCLLCIGAWHRHYRSCILPLGLLPPRTCLHPLLSGDLKLCYPPRWASTS